MKSKKLALENSMITYEYILENINLKSLPAFTKKHFGELENVGRKTSEKLFIHLKGASYCYCGKLAIFKGFRNGYSLCCSQKCLQNSSEHQSKLKQIFNKKYGVDNPYQSEEIKEKIKRKNLTKYGVEHNSLNPETIQKRKDTCKEKYGMDSWSRTAKGREQARKNLHSVEATNKRRETNLERYNAESSLNSAIVREKIKKTVLEKYGVPNIGLSKEISEKSGKTLKKRKLRSFYETLETNYTKPKFTVEEYEGTRGIYDWECKKCKTVFTSALFRGPVYCKKCYPNKQYNIRSTSRGELEIIEYLNNLGITNIVKSNRKLIKPLELDIVLPDYGLAIEFNGVYWHSETNGKTDKNYHLNKTKRCLEKNIQLIHIFDTEWSSKKEIVKDILSAKTGNNKTIFARKCKIRELHNKEKTDFLTDNHIQGRDRSSVAYGLFYENDLVFVATFGKSRFNKKYEWELIRMCSKVGFSVVGGASRLMKHFEKNVRPDSLITYADIRFSKGDVYNKLGFEEQKTSPPNYFYIHFRDWKNRILESRLKYQKHKLKNLLPVFDDSKSEWQNMKNNGFDRVWDCGNKVWTKEYETK